LFAILTVPLVADGLAALMNGAVAEPVVTVQVEPKAHACPFTVVDAGTEEVTVFDVAANGTCPAVIPEILLPPPPLIKTHIVPFHWHNSRIAPPPPLQLSPVPSVTMAKAFVTGETGKPAKVDVVPEQELFKLQGTLMMKGPLDTTPVPVTV